MKDRHEIIDGGGDCLVYGIGPTGENLQFRTGKGPTVAVRVKEAEIMLGVIRDFLGKRSQLNISESESDETVPW